jgi:hypothetical protein
MSVENYSKGFMYEVFIRRAFKCQTWQHGAHVGHLKILLDYEIGEFRGKLNYEKNFLRTQNYILKAIEKFLKRKPTPEEAIALRELLLLLSQSTNAFQLYEVVEKGLDITQRYREM